MRRILSACLSASPRSSSSGGRRCARQVQAPIPTAPHTGGKWLFCLNPSERVLARLCHMSLGGPIPVVKDGLLWLARAGLQACPLPSPVARKARLQKKRTSSIQTPGPEPGGRGSVRNSHRLPRTGFTADTAARPRADSSVGEQNTPASVQEVQEHGCVCTVESGTCQVECPSVPGEVGVWVLWEEGLSWWPTRGLVPRDKDYVKKPPWMENPD